MVISLITIAHMIVLNSMEFGGLVNLIDKVMGKYLFRKVHPKLSLILINLTLMGFSTVINVIRYTIELSV